MKRLKSFIIVTSTLLGTTYLIFSILVFANWLLSTFYNVGITLEPLTIPPDVGLFIVLFSAGSLLLAPVYYKKDFIKLLSCIFMGSIIALTAFIVQTLVILSNIANIYVGLLIGEELEVNIASLILRPDFLLGLLTIPNFLAIVKILKNYIRM